MRPAAVTRRLQDLVVLPPMPWRQRLRQASNAIRRSAVLSTPVGPRHACARRRPPPRPGRRLSPYGRSSSRTHFIQIDHRWSRVHTRRPWCQNHRAPAPTPLLTTDAAWRCGARRAGGEEVRRLRSSRRPNHRRPPLAAVPRLLAAEQLKDRLRANALAARTSPGCGAAAAGGRSPAPPLLRRCRRRTTTRISLAFFARSDVGQPCRMKVSSELP